MKHTPALAEEPVIRLRDVVKTYHSEAGDVPALKGLTADVYLGEFVGIIGKSGAGKSTLVNMMTGVDRLTAGEVWVAETPVHRLDEDQLAQWRGRNVGVVYQTFELLPSLSLLDNIMLPMDFCGVYRPRRSAERAMQLLRDVGLEEHAYKPPTRISGGQQQRVAIARALANDPPILVADEPTGNLDGATADEIIGLFETLINQGKTLVMVTHDESLASRVTRALRIVDGEIVDET